MSQDATRRATPDSALSTAFLPCSDCRAPMRTHYYALDTRPVCPKCRAGYERRIAFGRGRGSLARMLLWGGGAALAGALALGIVGSWVGFLRPLAALLVAWPVARAMNKATGDYYTRRKQVITVALVWGAISLAAIVPIAVRAMRLKPEAAAVAAPASDAAVTDSTSDEFEDLEAALAEEQAPRPATTLEDQKAAELRGGGFAKGLFVAIVLFLTLPLITAFGVWGIQAAAVALVGLGFALYKAWDWTSDGVSYEITGPHRVGTGPISATW